jgi:dihydroneopterin aldolase
MITIHLEQLRFFAFHGLYEEEQLLGNEFLVDIHLQCQPHQKTIHSIDETVDYTLVYEMIANRMKQPTALLESIATEFCNQVMEHFTIVDTIQISIKKLNPPISKFTGTVGVTYQFNRKDLK